MYLRVLGPLLFLIFVNDLEELLNSKSLQLADDLKITRKIETAQDCLMLQRDVDALSSWCTDNKITLNAEKCSVLKMTHRPIGRHIRQGRFEEISWRCF